MGSGVSSAVGKGVNFPVFPALKCFAVNGLSFFANVAYPISPLVNTGVGAMMFPKVKGFFVGPTVDFSLRSDLDLSFILQHFQGEFQENNQQQATLGFLRIKWSF